jgi:AcrR family transcriptional regulator
VPTTAARSPRSDAAQPPAGGATAASDARRDALEARIRQAALELFAERGYHGTSIPSVMERAGVGAGSLYRLFESKEALVNAVFRDAKGRLAAALASELPPDAGPRELFDDLWSRLAAFAEAEPLAFRFLELQDHTPYLDGASRQRELAVLAPIAVACMDLQRRGVLRSDVGADVIIAFVWGAFVGLVKAARLGYLKLGAPQVESARDAWGRAFASDGCNGERGEKPKWKRRTTT